jgi:myo-inositol-1(or 4)-monophosphatase
MSQNDGHFLQVARAAATRAGSFLMENLGKLNPRDIEEKAKNSFVTDVDRDSEKMIVEIIKKEFPDHAIIAEEGNYSETRNAYSWIIDPLDGTTNFIQNLPHFSVSIALRHDEKIIAGVVFNPVLNEMFIATAGEGAYLNDKPIQVNNDANFTRAVLATGFPHRFKTYLPKYVLAFQEIMLHCSGVRRWGSAALDLAYTACGRYHCFWELGLSPWDIAAGALIVQEAGGIVTDFWGKQNYLNSGYMIAGSRPIHRKLLEILSFHFKANIN